ncbi:nitroimidazol reductase NimA-like FMN-containing flavoprotein (pyridoxamine 5'-phosphate oxidase superfamily) [Rhodococcus sp. LBL1]|nr:nitroimidazol reductase NimA-like FMN-containing flavoprotein (pyridoxamine 5'-phosphate oxidase superfamily) [Rhodococcus sp. LBL1]MDH6685950.1 nitroimidazol reductase NimA-like FMN-containing flavoprotein (pyridoxamine 5'-phosphate oxidase superfamily) [Rhodococcus sp. LBL2]WFR74492.1 pyridoxamine 5'-phosphate oxidase family protein [Prescottella defluvii]
MPDRTTPVTALTEQEALDLLATERLGRLILVSGDQPDVYPVNYVVNDGKLYFRSAEGDKLTELKLKPMVTFQVDHADTTSAWSILVRGIARTLVRFDEINAAEELDLRSWVPTEKYNFVEIRPTEIAGRRFLLERG